MQCVQSRIASRWISQWKHKELYYDINSVIEEGFNNERKCRGWPRSRDLAGFSLQGPGFLVVTPTRRAAVETHGHSTPNDIPSPRDIHQQTTGFPSLKIIRVFFAPDKFIQRLSQPD